MESPCYQCQWVTLQEPINLDYSHSPHWVLRLAITHSELLWRHFQHVEHHGIVAFGVVCARAVQRLGAAAALEPGTESDVIKQTERLLKTARADQQTRKDTDRHSDRQTEKVMDTCKAKQKKDFFLLNPGVGGTQCLQGYSVLIIEDHEFSFYPGHPGQPGLNQAHSLSRRVDSLQGCGNSPWMNSMPV